MKKLFALVLALMLSLSAVAALAETELAIPVELVAMEDGLEFAVPTAWTFDEITDELAQQGIAVQAYDEATNRLFMVTIAQQANTYAAADLAALMAADTANYANAAAVTNQYGMEVVMFESADSTVGGFTFVDAEGMQYIFSYAHMDGSVISDDADLAALLAETVNTIGYLELEAAE